MDGVVADLVPHLLEQYNYLTNENIKIEDIRSNKISKWVGDPFLVRKLIETTGFMRGLPPTNGAIDTIEQLKKRRARYSVCF